MAKSNAQPISIYLGSGKMRERRLESLDKLAHTHVPEDKVSRRGSERSVLFQLLADNPNEASIVLADFFSRI